MSDQGAADRGPSLLRRAYSHLVFDVPIGRKLLVFCGGVGAWLCAIGSLGLVTEDDRLHRWVAPAMTIAAVGMVTAFGFLLTRSLRRPLDSLTRRIRALSDGQTPAPMDAGDLAHADDEVTQLSRQVDELVDRYRALSAFKSVIEEDESADDVYGRLSAEFAALGLARHSIYEVANSQNRLRPVCQSAGFPEGACDADMILNANLCRAKRTGEVVSSAEFPRVCKRWKGRGPIHVCVPLMVGGSTGGVVTFLVGEGPEERADLPARVARARRFIRESAGVIEAKRLLDALKQTTLRDPMTGLYNRRFLEEYAETMVASAERRKVTIGVLMCDVDHFKHVNDTHGHDVGDMVLKDVAAMLTKATRTSDLVIRYGGEEFLVILQDAMRDSAMEVAERIRAAVEGLSIRTGRGVLQRTISVGVAEFPGDAADLWRVVRLADLALYRAKAAGRNRCVRASADLEVAPEEPTMREAPGPAEIEAERGADLAA